MPADAIAVAAAASDFVGEAADMVDVVITIGMVDVISIDMSISLFFSVVVGDGLRFALQASLLAARSSSAFRRGPRVAEAGRYKGVAWELRSG